MHSSRLLTCFPPTSGRKNFLILLRCFTSRSSRGCRLMNTLLRLAGLALGFLSLLLLAEAATYYGSTLPSPDYPYRVEGCSGSDSVAYFNVPPSKLRCCSCYSPRCYGCSAWHEKCVAYTIFNRVTSCRARTLPLGARTLFSAFCFLVLSP